MTTRDPANPYESDLHPRVFCDPDELPALAERAQTGIGAAARDEILDRCRNYTTPGHADYVDPDSNRTELLGSGQWASPLAPVVHALSFAAVISDDDQWLSPCVRMLRTIASGEPRLTDFHWYFNYKYDAPEPICQANLSGHLPLAYDLLHTRLDEGDRELIGNYLRERIVAPYYQTLLLDRHKYAMSVGQNPPWHELYTWAWSLAAVYDHVRDEDREAMLLLTSLVRRAVHMGVDQVGTIGEGPGYGSHDVFRWVGCAEILRRAGYADLWQDPRFVAMLKHWTYLVLPNGTFLNRSDATGRSGMQIWALLMHARRANDPVAQWSFEQYGGRVALADCREQPVDAGAPGFYLLWDRPAAKATNPDAADWPSVKRGGQFGEHIIRTGWGAEDFVCSVLAGGRRHGSYIHQHADSGHFNVHALGEAFAIDTGYGDGQTRHHNVMRPNGGEPPTVGGGFEQSWEGGHTIAFADQAEAVYVCIDSAWQWHNLWNYRHVLMVNGPGVEPYLLILDNVNQNNDFGSYEWTLNTHPDNAVTIDQGTLTAKVQGATNHLVAAFVHPGAEDYPKPHKLKLATDEINSHVIGANPDGTDRILGIGKRPRLVGQLDGYNGCLLAGLFPRRAEQADLSVERHHAPHQFAMTVNHGDVVDTIVCSPIDRYLDLAGVTGEATLAVIRRDADAQITWWAGCDIAGLACDGTQLLAPETGLHLLATAQA